MSNLKDLEEEFNSNVISITPRYEASDIPALVEIAVQKSLETRISFDQRELGLQLEALRIEGYSKEQVVAALGDLFDERKPERRVKSAEALVFSNEQANQFIEDRFNEKMPMGTDGLFADLTTITKLVIEGQERAERRKLELAKPPTLKVRAYRLAYKLLHKPLTKLIAVIKALRGDFEHYT